MRKWEEQQSEFVHHVLIVNGEIVFQTRQRQVLFNLTLDHLLALIGQTLAVLHGHVLHNRLLEHA